MEREPGTRDHSAREAAVFDFVADFLDDRESGCTRSLTTYFARFPGPGRWSKFSGARTLARWRSGSRR
jgi:hypothetical protein